MDLHSPSAAWLALCRDVVRAQRTALRGLDDPGRAVGRRGYGGDATLRVDELLENAAVAVLHDELANADILTEEQGLIAARSEGASRLLMVLDPVDGSANARRGLPGFALSLAAASGPRVGDVFFGFVHDFGTNESFAAHADGWVALPPGHEAGPSALVAIDSVEYEPSLVARMIDRLETAAPRPFGLRIVGSTALAMSQVAASRIDCFLSAGHCRPLDFAAAQLIARVAGATVTCVGSPVQEIALDLGRTSRPVVAWDSSMLAWALDACESVTPDVLKERGEPASRSLS